jgi:A/G-specific adenine glycosylase
MPARDLIPAVEARRAASPDSSKKLLSSTDLPAFRRALLGWYDKNRRDLPWRRTRDPYRIWVSEIMLQQTRVAAVLEHYRLFLERFPDVKSLAAADESAVLAVWSGLGYYRRARMMRQCAQEIVKKHAGRFPEISEELQTLPGIGRYTAAAIASISFTEPVAVVDGNVERVLQRLAGGSLAPKEMWRRAQSQLSKTRPADFNQAMMELGALVCTPRRPACGACPAKRWCSTQGEPARPIPTQSQSKREIWRALDQRGCQIRLVQRPDKSSLMAGMWELPEPPSTSAAADQKAGSAPKRQKNSRPAPWRTFRHSITITDYTVHVRRGPAKNGKWVAIERIPDIPLTGLTRKILKAAGII